MKKFTKLVGGFFAIALLLFSNPTMASHFKGGDTYFVCTGNGYYKLVFACYYACESGSSTPYDFTLESFTLTSSCPSVPTTLTCVSQTPQQDVPLYCPGILTTCDYNPYSNAPAGTPTGTLVVVYQTDSFQIPPGCTVTAEISNGNRNGAITNLQNPANTYLDIAATVQDLPLHFLSTAAPEISISPLQHPATMYSPSRSTPITMVYSSDR